MDSQNNFSQWTPWSEREQKNNKVPKNGNE